MSEISRHGSGHLCANSWGSTEISSENAVISVYKKDVMGKTSNEMREYNEMPVSMIAKVHNSPAVQPWERICIAIMAEELQDQIWSSMELLREKSQPLIFVSCLFFFFFSPNILCSIWNFQCHISHFQSPEGQLLHPAFRIPKCVCLVSCIPRTTPLFCLCACWCSCACCRTFMLFSGYLWGYWQWMKILHWMSLLHIQPFG